MKDNSLPSLKEISQGMGPPRMPPRKECFFRLYPQIETWLQEGHTHKAVREKLAKHRFELSESSFTRYIRAARLREQDATPELSSSPAVELTASTIKSSRRKTPKEQPRPPSEVEPLVTRADLQARRDKREAAAATVAPDPQSVAEDETPTTGRLEFTMDLLKPVKGFKAPSLGEFTPRPAMKLEDI